MFKKKLLSVVLLSMATLGIVGCSGSDDSNENETSVVDLTKGEYKQKILIEDITSASCMWCPLATVAIDGLEKSDYKDVVIGVGAHGDFNANMVKDPFVIPGLSDLQKAVKQNGSWPFVAFNRNTGIKGTAFQSFLNQTASGVFEVSASKFETFQKNNKLINDGSPIGIKIASNLGATSGKVDVSLKFSQSINQDLKYVVYILEDGLVFRQANATAMYGNNTGEPAWSTNFVHDHVIRATNNFLGEAVPADQTKTTSEFTATANLTYQIEDLAKTSVVVAVLDSKGNVLNAQKAKGNTTQDYQKK